MYVTDRKYLLKYLNIKEEIAMQKQGMAEQFCVNLHPYLAT